MSIVKHCVLPVAGYGTRFLPASKSIPKEMFPVLNKPLIHFSIEEAFECGIKNFTVVTNKHKEAIKHYLKEGSHTDDFLQSVSKQKLLSDLNKLLMQISVNYRYQESMTGLGHAISLARKSFLNEPFAVILPDDLCFNRDKSVLHQMIQIHEMYPDHCIVAVEKVPRESVSSYGIVDATMTVIDKVYEIKDMVEKPAIDKAPSDLAIIGRYILSYNIFDTLDMVEPDHNGEIQITNALKILAKEGKVLAYEFEGTRYDCGSISGYVSANYDFSKLNNML